MGDRLSTLDEKDALVIYFTGHAYFDQAREQRVILYDADRRNHLRNVSVREWAFAIRSPRVGQTLVIFDTCFSAHSYAYVQ
jgi:hypothetical protein